MIVQHCAVSSKLMLTAESDSERVYLKEISVSIPLRLAHFDKSSRTLYVNLISEEKTND